MAGLASLRLGVLAYGLALSSVALAQAPAPPPVPKPEPRAQVRTVKPGEVTVVSGAAFRVGRDLYQVEGVRTPRPNGGRCLFERIRGRESRKELRQILARGEIRIEPTGAANPRTGARLAQVSVQGRSVRQDLIARKAALPRAGNETGNPWCVRLR